MKDTILSQNLDLFSLFVLSYRPANKVLMAKMSFEWGVCIGKKANP